MPAAQDLGPERILVRIERLKLAIALVLAREGDAGGQHDRDHHRQPLDQHVAECKPHEEKQQRRHEHQRRHPLGLLEQVRPRQEHSENDQGNAANDVVGLEQVDDH